VLVDAKADVHAKRVDGKTAIDLARGGGFRPIERLLAEAIAERKPKTAGQFVGPDWFASSRSGDLEALRQLLADNPRWYEDPPVRAERSRLLNDAADMALYPFLFHGTERARAAQGLGLALELYQITGDEEAARGVATDLIEIYPETPEAQQAAAIQTKPKPADKS
jgi:hypothetical protein